MRRALLATAFVAGALVPALDGASAIAETITVRPAADGYVESAHPRSNYGRSPELLAEGSRPVRRIFLRFNVRLPPGHVATRATLRLFARSGAAKVRRELAPG